MTKRILLRQCITCFLVCFVFSTRGFAASQEFCQTYARHALEQFEVAKGEGCKNLSFPVWSMDFNHHYNWCLTVPETQTAQGEEKRLSVLRECSGKNQNAVITGYEKMATPEQTQPSATSEQTCRDYAFKAVEQQQINMGKGCNQQGPSWNSNHSDHYNWCMHGQNVVHIERELQARQTTLDACSPEGKILKVLPFPNPQSPPPAIQKQGGEVISPKAPSLPTIDPGLAGKTSRNGTIIPTKEVSRLALNRARNDQIFSSNWQGISTRYLDNINVDVQKTLATHLQQHTQGLYANFHNSTFPSIKLSEKIETVKNQAREQQMASPSSVQNQRITSIRGFPTPEFLEPGGLVIISGSHFGADSGKVILKYEESRSETQIFKNQAPPHHIVELTPYRKQVGRRAPDSGWGDSWSDGAIIAQLPESFPGQKLYYSMDGKDAQLIIQGSNQSFALTQSVKIRPSFPYVGTIQTSSGMTEFGGRIIEKEWYQSDGREHIFIIGKRLGDTPHHLIRPGDDIFIYGSGFGSQPGKIALQFTESVLGILQIPLQPGSQDWWHKDRIHLKVGAMAGDHQMHFADLHIQTNEGREWVGGQFAFGPKTTLKIVSGKQWLQFDSKEDDDTFNPNLTNEVLLVSHHPGCGTSLGFFRTGSGESGTDLFFMKKPLPQHVELVAIHFKQLDPDNLESDISQLGNIVKKAALEFLVSGGFGAFKTFGGQGLSMFFEGLTGGGGYYASILPPKSNDMSVGVRWANLCAGDYVDVPLKYLISFTLQGPEDILNSL